MLSKAIISLTKPSLSFPLSYRPLKYFSTMKHIGLTGFGDTSVLTITESQIPQPKEDQVLIKVKTSALNRADTMQRRGKYPPPKGASEILGLEAAGYICKPDGSCDESRRVMALLDGGGHAQYCVAHKGCVLDVPENLVFEQAGGIPETWITAFLLLELGQIKPKDKVLIYAGASGVGTAAIQLTRFFGGIPIVTCSTEDKIEYTKDLGAEAAINYKKTDNLAKSILEATGGKGANIILDCVGPDYFSTNCEAAAVDAKWILYGLLTGAKVPNANFASFVGKRLSLIATTLRSRSFDYKADLVNRFREKVMPGFKDGRLKVKIDSLVNVDWTDPKPVQEAHKRMEENKNSGKIILSFK